MESSTATAVVVTTAGFPTIRGGAGISWRIAAEAFLAARVSSPNTRRAYRRALVDALEAIGRERLADVTGLDLAGYRAALLADGRAPSSHSVALAALRSFLLWTAKPHVAASRLTPDVIRDALEMPKARVLRPYQVPSNPELAAMLAHAATPRDRALLGVLAGAGLRISEAVALDVRDLREDPDGCAYLHVRNGKGAKDRMVPIRPELVALVRAHLAATGRTIGDAGPLFTAYDRGARARGARRISVRGAAGIVTRATAAAGIVGKRLSPHSLRHGFAIRALRAGANVFAVSKLLGHSSAAVTGRYLDHCELPELLAAVPALP